MFHLQSLELLHWDYCQRLSLPLDGAIITVAGPNGSGKTTLLDAMRTLLGLECSGGRNYKTYARHANADAAWLRATVENRPRNRQASSRPFARNLLYSDQVTLACRIERNGGDWVRRYLMAEGDVAIEELAQRPEKDWLGIEHWRKRLEGAGLSRAIARVLALEQGQTDRLCEYSPKELLRLVFVKEHRGYRVRRELRETVLFAVHDVLKDSPFSRLDLISCRNLLIYLTREAQRRVLEIFHFALAPGGRLFLGSSEAVEDGSPLFTVTDKKHRLYQQRATPRVGLPIPSAPGTLVQALQMQANLKEAPVIAGRAFVQGVNHRQRGGPVTDRVASWGELHLRLLEHLAPPSILVDSEYEIVHLSPSAGRYLQFGGGEPTRNLLRSVPASLRIELRAALYQAGQAHAPVDVGPVAVELAGSQPTPVNIRVTPANDIGTDLFLVVLQEQQASAGPVQKLDGERADPVAQHLDREIERLKSHLRDTVEQYEASTEELKASNEELQAMNEELRSATEELETSREELQSINEELTTVNQELKTKVDELGSANSDMHNLMDATAIATVFLDRELRITRYTPSAVSLFNLIPTDVGRPLTDLTTHLQYPDMVEDARRVLERLVPIEREVGQSDGSWFLARLLPYRTVEDRIAGVVLSFVNITERKQAEEMRLWLSAVVTSTSDGIISFSLDQAILSWNAGAENIFGYKAEEAIGQPMSLLAPGRTGEQDRLAEMIASGQRVENFETVRVRSDGTEVQVALTVSPIRDSNGKVLAGTAIVRDITAARAAAEALRSSGEALRRTVEQTRAALRDQQVAAGEIGTRATQLLQTRLDAQQRELAEAIRRDAIPLHEAIARILQND